MTNQETLFEYSESIRRLKKQCSEAGITDEEFRKMYFESLDSLNTQENAQTRNSERRITWKHQIVFIVVVILFCSAYNFRAIYSCLVCNLQDYVYPGLRLLRRISIPFISLFPSLTDWYHESCLIQNPFFTVVDMDCWPCSTVTSVREINEPEPVHQQHSAPFIYETNQQEIHLETLKDLYVKHKDVFNRESSRILVNNKYSINPEEMFERSDERRDNSFYFWRFNNMNVARILRQIIPRPKVVPKFGQSTERFLIIDSSQKQFSVPDTECNFSFLQSLNGRRTVNLIPAEECKAQCRSLKIDLKENYLLWYNWWYWRPVIEPSIGNATFIAHVGSYC